MYQYHQRRHGATTSQTTLPDQLNEFYAQFEAQNPDQQIGMVGVGSTQASPFMVTSANVRKVVNKTNP